TITMVTTDRTTLRALRAGLRRCRWAAAMLLVACGPVGLARAAVLIEGTPAALRVTADQAAISDVLAAMATRFNATYRSAIPLDARAGPAYAGSLPQVIARLLDGYNYVVKRSRPGVEIVVFGRRGEMAIPPPARSAPPSGILARWR